MGETEATRAWVLPEESLPVRLMSTVWADGDGLHDDFATVDDIDAWLEAVGLDRAGERSVAAELEMARELRDAVRRLAAEITADDRPAAQSATQTVGQALLDLNRVVGHLSVPHLVVTDGGFRETSSYDGTAVSAALAHVARESIALLGGPSAGGLRACHAPGCVLYFTKTHPRREWCSVTCGNRVRAARHYDKVRSTR